MLHEKIIEIKSKTVNNFGEEDVMEIKTVGKYGIKNGKTYLSYDEGGALGVDGVTTILKAQDNLVVLTRTGSLESRLEIEKGERHQCHYSTVYGDLFLGIFGEVLENNFKEDGGKLFMSYTLDVNCEFMSRNDIEITVKEV